MDLNPSQKAAVEHSDGPILVLAGAGSGKTRVVTTRIARLLERGVPARAILAVTFTNKAAREMKERVTRLVGKAGAALWVSTFHSFGLQVLRNEARSFGFESGAFTIFDQGDVAGTVREILRETKGTKKYDIGAILARISNAKSQLLGDDELPDREADEYDEITKIVWPRYKAALRTFHAFDFDDLVSAPVQLWSSRRDVLERWQTRFRYLLVDEYQDTNKAQFEMVRLLCDPHRNLMVVGDDDQSIYAWRGADVSNILDFDRHFPGAKVVKLEENYRSAPSILSVANAVLAKSSARRHGKVLRATRGQGTPVELVTCPDPDAEAVFIAETIDGLVREGVAQNEIAVLYRSNLQSDAIESALKERRLSPRVLGGTQFFERKEVKDLLAYLRVAMSPKDEIALRRVLNYPARHIGETSLERIEAAALSRGKSLFQMVRDADSIDDLPSATKTGCRAFVAVLDEASAQVDAGRPAVEIARGLADAIGLQRDIADAAGSGPMAARRWGNVEALLRVLGRYDQKNGRTTRKTLGELVQFLAVGAENEEKAESNAITLTTMHGAKGLEYQCVFLAGLEEGLLPHARTFEERVTDVGGAAENDVEEERRLFYVSITRAKDRLWLCRCEQRALRGKPVKRAPSRFLADIPEELLTQRRFGTPGAPTVIKTAERSAALLEMLSKLSESGGSGRR